MRRKDREITDIAEIIGVMKKCDVCRLGLNDNGYPYILPLNFGMEVNGEKITLYFHSALEGHKVGLIQADNRASFEMDCGHELEYIEEKGYKSKSHNLAIRRWVLDAVKKKEPKKEDFSTVPPKKAETPKNDTIDENVLYDIQETSKATVGVANAVIWISKKFGKEKFEELTTAEANELLAAMRKNA